MDRRSSSVGLWTAVVVAAFVGAIVIVRTSREPILRVDAGELGPNIEPPAHALGAADELVAKTRCVALVPNVSLGEVAPGQVDFGGAAVDARGLVAIGVVRTKDKERLASVITFTLGDSATSPPRVVDLGTASGDDPPPRPFVTSDSLLVARIETGRERRRLLVTELGAVAASGELRGVPKEPIAIEQAKDESLAFDIASDGAGAWLVWDEDAVVRGAVRAMRWPAANVANHFVVSGPSSDAEAPRVVGDGEGGAWIAWISRKPEGDAGLAELTAHMVESPAEGREARWVEVARIDAQGAIRGAPVRLSNGRVSDFDLRPLPGESSVEIVMRDEEGVVEARGARLIRQVVKADSARPGTLEVGAPVRLLGDGVGATDPTLVDDGTFGLVAYGDVMDRPRVLPSGTSTGAPADGGEAKPSPEVLLEGGRVLTSRALANIPVGNRLAGRIGRGAARGALVISAGSKQDRAEARILLCER